MSPRKRRIASPRPVPPEALKRTLSLLEATFDSTADGLLVVDRGGRITAFNRKYAQLWGIPDSILTAKADEEVLGYVLGQVKDPDAFLAKVRELYARPEAESSDVIEFKDGRVFERYSQPQRIAGKAVGRVWSFRDVTARRRAEQVQHAAYRISQATLGAQSLEDLLHAIHEIVATLMPAQNFYVALLDAPRHRLTFPYFVDERDPAITPRPLGKGLTEYVIRSGEALLATPEVDEDLVRRGEVELVGPPSIDWLGVPLRVRDRTIGAVVVQSYSAGVRHTDADKDLLTFVSSHVALAIERRHTGEELQRQTDLLQRIVDHIPVMLVFIDERGRVTWGNREWSRVLGYTVDEAQARDVLAELYADPAELARVRASIASPPGVWHDFHTSARDGRVLDTTWAGVPLPGGGHLAIGLDVTERRRADQALRESRDLLHAVVEGSLDAVFAKDRDGRYLFINTVAARSIGHAPEHVVGRTDEELLPAEVAAVFRAVDRRIIETGETQILEDADAAPGGARTFLLTKGPLRTSNGQIAGVFGVARDITDRKAAEESTRQSEERYRSFIEHSTEAVWRFEIDPPCPLTLPEDAQVEHFYEHAHVAECNDAMARMYGHVAAREMLGARPADLLVRSDPRNDESFRAFIRAGYRLTDAETHERDAAGRSKVFLNNYIGILSDGHLVRIWGTQRDVTEQRRLEGQFRQIQKMEAVGQLAGGIAHDFNNILTAILGTGQLLLRDMRPDDPLRDDVEEIRRAALRAADLTRQLLAYSRRQILAPKVLDLNVIVSGLGPMLRRLLGEDVQLTTTLAPNLGPVRADPGQVEQVIVNLAVNARDAMPGGGRLSLTTRNEILDAASVRDHAGAAPGPYVVLAARDNGTGMAPEVRSHLFEPFFTTKEVGKGTGLGLATVYGIVRQSGGFIAVATELGQGSTFHIYLPRVDAVVQTDNAPSPSRGRLGGTETVLLVEDEESVRNLSRRGLEAEGYTVISAGNAVEAVDALERVGGPIHLLVTDLVMPGMGGRDLAQRLTQVRPTLRVLYISGYSNDVVAKELVLLKPFTPDELARRVRDVLDGHPTDLALAAAEHRPSTAS